MPTFIYILEVQSNAELDLGSTSIVGTYGSFPVDIIIYVQVQAIEIRFTCMPTSLVQCLLHLPSLDLVFSSKKSINILGDDSTPDLGTRFNLLGCPAHNWRHWPFGCVRILFPVRRCRPRSNGHVEQIWCGVKLCCWLFKDLKTCTKLVERWRPGWRLHLATFNCWQLTLDTSRTVLIGWPWESLTRTLSAVCGALP